jgi:hypothetical protein
MPIPDAGMPADQYDERLLLLADADNVLVAKRLIGEGEEITVSGRPVRMARPVLLGHKIARRVIEPAEKVIKYGVPIGSATRRIEIGEHVHVHNMQSDYTRTHVIEASDEEKAK